MKQYKIGAGFTIFVLFFGIALLEAFQDRNWFRIIFWMVMGIIFFLADNSTRPEKTE